MTENEAIKQIRKQICNEKGVQRYCRDNCMHGIEHCAYSMAIQALEENQQYRAIGTVEDMAFYKKCYDEESYEYCGEYGTDNCGCKDRMEHLKKKIAEFEAIGTIEEFKALKEKSVAKKPDYEGDSYYNGQIVYDIWICPNCEKHYEVDYDDYDYCPNCGQHIDHSELTEDD